MNTRFPSFSVLAAALAFGFSPGAEAAEYTQVNETASTISFTYNQFSSRVYGTFDTFKATLDFDTDNPEEGRAALTIQLDSIDAGSEDANTELQRPAWFDTQKYPEATFESTTVNELGDHRYSITGKLTLRGVTREVTVPVLLKEEEAIGIFDGQLTLKRSDFKVGEGEWGDTVVSDDIIIRFRMVAPQR
ncbi:YceI family protein [Pseudomonas sp. FSL W5-0299]|uniref:YceI family protein n=1 Tax=Pseudomonas sp. FSL W5-0299 TaxID=1917484 RepID=UPI00098B5CE8|nr:YceI family protein [Pseudomonas sp. FSL W5-0299]OOL34828.1 polyisoprenoid-binding protein [Pseudomonas sp. FSL W5-0299]